MKPRNIIFRVAPVAIRRSGAALFAAGLVALGTLDCRDAPLSIPPDGTRPSLTLEDSAFCFCLGTIDVVRTETEPTDLQYELYSDYYITNLVYSGQGGDDFDTPKTVGSVYMYATGNPLEPATLTLYTDDEDVCIFIPDNGLASLGVRLMNENEDCDEGGGGGGPPEADTLTLACTPNNVYRGSTTDCEITHDGSGVLVVESWTFWPDDSLFSSIQRESGFSGNSSQMLWSGTMVTSGWVEVEGYIEAGGEPTPFPELWDSVAVLDRGWSWEDDTSWTQNTSLECNTGLPTDPGYIGWTKGLLGCSSGIFISHDPVLASNYGFADTLLV